MNNTVQIDAPLSVAPHNACPICQRGLCNNREVLIANCGHRYHEDCIDWWLSVKGLSAASCRVCDATTLPLVREAGAAFNESSRYCESQPLYVCRSGNAEALGHLLTLHPTIVREYFRTAATGEEVLLLHVAIRENQSACLQALVKHGADLNAATKNGDKALHVAARAGSLECLKVLLEAGVDVNANTSLGANALHLCTEKGHHDCLWPLIKAGVGVNTQTSFSQKTSLHIAAEAGYLSCLKILLIAGADPACITVEGKTALHIAAERGDSDCLEIIATEIDESVINTANAKGKTALHLAARGGHWECVKVLVKWGADVNTTTFEGKTALYICVEKTTAIVCKYWLTMEPISIALPFLASQRCIPLPGKVGLSRC